MTQEPLRPLRPLSTVRHLAASLHLPIVARFGWATAIHFASASGGGPGDAFISEGLQPIVRQHAAVAQRGRRHYNGQPQQPEAQQQAQPAPAARGKRRR